MRKCECVSASDGEEGRKEGERGEGGGEGVVGARTSERVLVLQDLAEVQDAEVRRRRRALVLPLCRPGGAGGRYGDVDAGGRDDKGRKDGRTDG